jgi:membrane fusion protein (multidrug efflux system)
MDAEVDVSNKDGKTLADAPRDAAVAHTQSYGTQDDAADRDVQRVIAANTGKAAVKSAKAAGAAKPVLPTGGAVLPALAGGEAQALAFSHTLSLAGTRPAR